MFSPCLCGFSPRTPASSHSPRTCVWGQVEKGRWILLLLMMTIITWVQNQTMDLLRCAFQNELIKDRAAEICQSHPCGWTGNGWRALIWWCRQLRFGPFWQSHLHNNNILFYIHIWRHYEEGEGGRWPWGDCCSTPLLPWSKYVGPFPEALLSKFILCWCERDDELNTFCIGQMFLSFQPETCTVKRGDEHES